MRAIERLLHKARRYKAEGTGRSMGFICRNYDGGGDWLCRITKIIKGVTGYDERKFPTQDDAIQWAETQLRDNETILIDNI